MKTDIELKQLAADIFENKVFTDRHLRTIQEINMTFYSIPSGVFEGMTKEEIANIGLIYEYRDKALSRSVNGHPVFVSSQFLTLEEFKQMDKFYEEYKAMKESFLK